MEKLSILIFSRDDVKQLFGLVRSIYNICNEIVIIDSSNTKNRREIQEQKYNKRLKKIRLFYSPALGHSEPYQHYAIKLCKNNWIFHIDTDEKPSEKLKATLNELINEPEYTGFLLNRIEYKNKNQKSHRHSYHLRLFNREKISFKGYIHEYPTIKGKIKMLGNSLSFYHLDKNINYKTHKYIRIERFESRISYDDAINQNFWHLQSVHSKFTFAFLPILMYLKLKTKFKISYIKKELSLFDYKLINYYLYFLILSLDLVKLDPSGFSSHIFYMNYQNSKINAFYQPANDERELEFSISQEVKENGGPISYLSFDEKILNKLNNKSTFKNFKGIELFIFLLKSRYKNGKYYYKSI